jgi:hypothetical protein
MNKKNAITIHRPTIWFAVRTSLMFFCSTIKTRQVDVVFGRVETLGIFFCGKHPTA